MFKAPQGLALCMVIVSTFLRRPIPPSHLFIGEVDLRRALRSLRPALMQELANFIATDELGLPPRIICPGAAAVMLNTGPDIEIVPTETLDEAIRTTWSDVH